MSTTTKTAAPLTAQTFYGTDEETYYCAAGFRLWCVQSPDLAATGGKP